MSKHTIADIAQRAGVGIATVSRALSGARDVSPTTRARVLAIAAELGYQPNVVAQRLQRRRAATIAYVPEVGERPAADMQFKNIITVLADRCASQQLDLLIRPAPAGDVSAIVDVVRSGRADGLIVADTRVVDERVAALAAARLPFVAFGRTSCTLPYAYVDLDSAAGTRAATMHLIERGHRRIAFLGLPQCYTYALHRSQGYHDALVGSGIAPDPALVVSDLVDETSTRAAVQAILAHPEPPTAIVAAADLLAIYTLHAASALGRRVGHDLALVGFDDLPLAAHTTPPLTTVRQSFAHICDLLIDALQQVITGDDGPAPCALVQPELVVRASS